MGTIMKFVTPHEYVTKTYTCKMGETTYMISARCLSDMICPFKKISQLVKLLVPTGNIICILDMVVDALCLLKENTTNIEDTFFKMSFQK